MATPSAYIPTVEPATEEDIEEICEDLKLGVNEEQQEEYMGFVNEALKGCDVIQDIEEETIPVLYPRIPGRRPPKIDNPYNAWASHVVIKGEPTGLLAGKKIAVKDNIFIAGTPLSNGSKIWDGYTPEFDATVVTRILQAGGTIVGKATCENQCFSCNSFTSASGPVLNPHDTSRTSGGSSSGSAVLVVTGEVDMALGGDQGGSIRIPSSCTGCVGLKPTWGLVPVSGSIGMMPSMDHLGPMAANVTDVALLLEVIAGYDGGRDHRQRPDIKVPSYSQMLEGNLPGKKVGYVAEGFINCTEGVKTVIDECVGKMRGVGAIVEEVSIPLHTKSGSLYQVLLAAYYESMIRNAGQAAGYNEFYQVSAARHLSMALQCQAHEMQTTVKAITIFGEYMRRKDGGQILAQSMNKIPTVRKAYDSELEKYDVLIMPTVPFVAPQLPPPELSVSDFVKETLKLAWNTGVFNITGHPALSLNVGMALPEDGGTKPLPVGLMIAGRHFEEVKVLDIAFGIEKLLGGKILAQAMNKIPTVCKAHDSELEIYDVLVMPTVPFVAPKLPPPEFSVSEFIMTSFVNSPNACAFNISGHPALSMKVGMALPEDGGAKPLPVGLMIVGRHFGEVKVLDIAFGIEKLLGSQ